MCVHFIICLSNGPIFFKATNTISPVLCIFLKLAFFMISYSHFNIYDTKTQKIVDKNQFFIFVPFLALVRYIETFLNQYSK